MRRFSLGLLSTICTVFIATYLYSDVADLPGDTVDLSGYENSVEISQSGDFTYQIPIQTPEFHGLEPNLSLRYSSSSKGNARITDVLGVGWRLSGLSEITRKVPNGMVPLFDEGQDIYYLDGEPLLACMDAGATNPWEVLTTNTATKTYFPDFTTTEASASCTAGGNLSTRIESYKKIVFDDTNNQFTVTKKNGTQYIYTAIGDLAGVSASDPDVELVKLAHQTRWLLSEVRDTQTANGSSPNTVTFGYSFASSIDGLAHRVSSISYGSYEVAFGYEQKSAALSEVANGTEYLSRQFNLLSLVEVKHGSNLIRAYDLEYIQRNPSDILKVDRLEKLTEYGSDAVISGTSITSGTSLPPHEFTYSPETLAYTATDYPGHIFHKYTNVTDFNGDGKDELVAAYYGVRKITYKEDGDTFFRYEWSQSPNGTMSFDFPSYRYEFLNQTGGFASTDHGFASAGCEEQWHTNSYSGSGGGGIANKASTSSIHLQLDPNRAGWAYCIRPWSNQHWNNNGDQAGYTTGFEVLHFDLSTGTINQTDNIGEVRDLFMEAKAPTAKSIVLASDKIEITDIGFSPITNVTFPNFGNEDHSAFDTSSSGVSEFVSKLNGSEMGIFKRISSNSYFNSVEATNDIYNLVGTSPIQNQGDKIGISDVTGDGVADAVRFIRGTGQNHKLQIYTGLGHGFTGKDDSVISEELTYNLTVTGSQSFGNGLIWGMVGARHTLADLNGDGLNDLILHSGNFFSGPWNNDREEFNPFASDEAALYLNTGSEFIFVQTIDNYLGIGDFDGNGVVDVYAHGGDKNSPGRIYFADNQPANLLTSVDTPLGETISVTYGSSVDHTDNIYLSARVVVDEITNRDGRGQDRVTKYAYEGGRYDVENRQSLGFSKITKTLPRTDAGDLIETSVYLNNDIADAGKLLSSEIKYVADSDGAETIFSKDEYTYSKTFAGNGPFKVVQTEYQNTEHRGTKALVKTTQQSINLYGEPDWIKDLGYTGEADDEVISYFYAPNLSDYIVNKPSAKIHEARDLAPLTNPETVRTWPSTGTVLRVSGEFYSYDGALNYTTAPTIGNVTKIEQWDGSLSHSTRTVAQFTHDDYGNVLTETNARNFQTTHTYDLNGLFLIQSENALNHIVQSSWDEGCQLPTTTIDPNGQSTVMQYDALCRETQTSYPNGQVVTTSYNNIGDPTAQYVEKSQSSAANGATGQDSFVTREYFDALGQTYLMARSSANSDIAQGQAVLVSFDERGRKTKETVPVAFADAISGAALNGATTDYTLDKVGRVTRVDFADGAQTRTTFGTQKLTTWYENGQGNTESLKVQVVANRYRNEACFDGDAATVCMDSWQRLDKNGRVRLLLQKDKDITDIGETTVNRITNYEYDILGRLIEVNDPEDITFTYEYDAFGNRTRAIDPGLGDWTLEYDANNNLTKQTDAKGQTIEFTYDALDRPLNKTVTWTDTLNNPQVDVTSTAYDERSGAHPNIGQITTQTLNGNVIETEYGSNGLPKQITHKVAGDTFVPQRDYVFEYSYTPDNALLGETYLTSPTETTSAWLPNYQYDASSRLTGFGSYITGTNYDLRDQPTQMSFGSGVVTNNTYDADRGWLLTSTVTAAGASTASSIGYTRSETGRVMSKTHSDPRGQFNYVYDYAGRLLAANNTGGHADFTQSFTYDAAGRMRSNTALGTYSYTNNADNAHAPNQVGTDLFSYDANGNMTVGLSGKQMTYDGENRPLSVIHNGVVTTYVYGADGTRLKKIDDAGGPNESVTLYLPKHEIRNYGTAAEEIYAYPLPSIRIKNGTEVDYLHADQLGSIIAMTDDAGVLTERRVYRPFGEIGHTSPTDTDEETKGFIGERYDAGAGLQYLNARYYDPELGTFLQPDWFEVTEKGVGPNRYAYSANDPINLMDPLGNTSIDSRDNDKDDDQLGSENELEQGDRPDLDPGDQMVNLTGTPGELLHNKTTTPLSGGGSLNKSPKPKRVEWVAGVLEFFSKGARKQLQAAHKNLQKQFQYFQKGDLKGNITLKTGGKMSKKQSDSLGQAVVGELKHSDKLGTTTGSRIISGDGITNGSQQVVYRGPTQKVRPSATASSNYQSNIQIQTRVDGKWTNSLNIHIDVIR